jgi:glycosyltransferase involved in cell wall biosynthesis
VSVPTYSIVVPAYNEGPRIGACLDQVLHYATQQNWETETVVVNDGSIDETAAIVRTYSQRDVRVRLVENPGNRGKGYSVRNGMRHARGEILLFTDADLSAPIREAAKLVAALRSGADVAIGSRWMRPELMTERQPAYRQLLGRMFNLALRLGLGLKFKDTQCGIKAFTRPAALQLFSRQRIERWGFDPELLFLARRLGLRTVEVPVDWAHDERSKIHPFRDGMQMVFELACIRWYALRGRYKGSPPSMPEEVPEKQNFAPAKR